MKLGFKGLKKLYWVSNKLRNLTIPTS